MYHQLSQPMSKVLSISTYDDNGKGSPGVDVDSPKMADGYPSGSSSESFSYVGTQTDGDGNVTVMLLAKDMMVATGLTADDAGGIFDPGSGGTYCLLNLGKIESNQDWTVRVRTTKDGKGGGVTYSAGTGGGPGGA